MPPDGDQSTASPDAEAQSFTSAIVRPIYCHRQMMNYLVKRDDFRAAFDEAVGAAEQQCQADQNVVWDEYQKNKERDDDAFNKWRTAHTDADRE